ncbi:pyroglutamyl-peptidase I [Thermococcus sp.]
MRVFVTGFEPFGGEKINPSWEAVKALPDELNGAELIKVQLPVSFNRVRELLPRLIVKERPEVVLLTGQAGGRPNVTVERVAINVMDSTIPDNDGFAPEDEPVFEGAPDAYFATIPIKTVVKALRNAGIPAGVSNTAGTYVCNTAMFTALHTIAVSGMEARTGFIHVPLSHAQALEKPRPSMAQETINRAIRVALESLLE